MNQIDYKKPFKFHISEIKKRIIQLLLIWLVLFGIGFYIKNILLSVILKPILESKYYSGVMTTSVTDSFFIYYRTIFYFANIFILPFFIYHITCFIWIALSNIEQRFYKILILFSIISFIFAILFCYFIVIPYSIIFFEKCLIDDCSFKIIHMVNICHYLSFVKSIILSFAIVFQFPAVLILSVKMKILSEQVLRDNRRYFILIVFAISAIVTPPDIISQFVMAIPMIAFYELVIIFTTKSLKNNGISVIKSMK